MSDQITRRQFGVWIIGAAGAMAGLSAVSQGQMIPPDAQSTAQFPQYVDVTQKAGIHFRHSFGERKLSSILESTGSGCAWFDYNNDGLMDLYVLSGRHIPGVTDHSDPDGVGAMNHLYRNNGDGTFTDVTKQAGVGGNGFAMGVTVGDYDNDGYDEIYVTKYEKTRFKIHNSHDT